MRTPFIPAVLVVAFPVALFAAPADACFAPVFRPPPPGKTATLDRGMMRVVVADDGTRSTWTLAGEVKGDVRRFSLMIPVPTRVTKKQVSVLKSQALDLLVAQTAPRGDVRQDPDPCRSTMDGALEASASLGDVAAAPAAKAASGAGLRASDFGVAVESHIQVGGYDIAVLSAKDERGLARWLRKFKYDVPEETERLMADYLRRGWRFLVARVNLKKLLRERFTSLRPLQIRFPNHQLELPVRLPAVAARGEPIDVTVLALFPSGMASLERTLVARLPTGDHVPPYAALDVTTLHEAVVGRQWEKNPKAAMLEFYGTPRPLAYRSTLPVYADLGAPWVNRGEPLWTTRYRLRLQGDPARDLVVEPVEERQAFEVVYVAQKPWQPSSSTTDDQLCESGRAYLKGLATRIDGEVDTLHRLTGWERAEIAQRVSGVRVIRAPPPPPPPKKPPPPPRDEPVAAQATSEVSSTWIALGLGAFVLLLIGFGRWQRRG